MGQAVRGLARGESHRVHLSLPALTSCRRCRLMRTLIAIVLLVLTPLFSSTNILPTAGRPVAPKGNRERAPVLASIDRSLYGFRADGASVPTTNSVERLSSPSSL